MKQRTKLLSDFASACAALDQAITNLDFDDKRFLFGHLDRRAFRYKLTNLEEMAKDLRDEIEKEERISNASKNPPV